jgi:hypothetical protein
VTFPPRPAGQLIESARRPRACRWSRRRADRAGPELAGDNTIGREDLLDGDDKPRQQQPDDHGEDHPNPEGEEHDQHDQQESQDHISHQLTTPGSERVLEHRDQVHLGRRWRRLELLVDNLTDDPLRQHAVELHRGAEIAGGIRRACMIPGIPVETRSGTAADILRSTHRRATRAAKHGIIGVEFTARKTLHASPRITAWFCWRGSSHNICENSLLSYRR